MEYTMREYCAIQGLSLLLNYHRPIAQLVTVIQASVHRPPLSPASGKAARATSFI